MTKAQRLFGNMDFFSIGRTGDKDQDMKNWLNAKEKFCSYLVQCAFQGKVFCKDSYGEVKPVKIEIKEVE